MRRRLVDLHVENYRSFREADVPFGELTSVCVTGENGAGKSTLFVDAPLWCLFGSAHCDLDDVVGIHADKAVARLKIAQDDAVVYVQRTRDKARAKSTLTIAHADGSPIVAGIDDAQSYINETILNGCSYRELVASLYMVQGEHSAFTKAKPAEAREMFVRFLALDRWLDRAKLVGERLRQAEGAAFQARNTLSNIPEFREVSADEVVAVKAKADELQNRSDELVARLATLNAELAVHDEKSERLRAAQKAFVDVKAEIEALKPRLFDAKRDLDGLSEHSSADAEALEARIQELDAAAAEHARYEQEKSRLEFSLAEVDGRIPAIEERVTKLEAAILAYADAMPVCDKCQRVLDTDASVEAAKSDDERKLASARSELDIANRSRESYVEKLAGLHEPDYDDREHTKTRIKITRALEYGQAKTRYDSLAERMSYLEDALASRRQEVGSAGADLPDVHDLKREHDDVSAKIGGVKAELDGTREALRVLMSDQDAYTRYSSQKAMAQEALDAAEFDVERFSLAKTAFGKNGIPAFLLDNAIPAIEDTANRYLSMLSAGQLSLRIETQRELKGGGARESLEVMVSDGLYARPFRTFSGGQACRINIALRIALAETVATRSGLDMSMLVIDEPEGLDGKGQDAFRQALSVASKSFETIVLVSHHESLREALPQQVIVTSGAGGSVVTTRTEG